MAVSPPSPASPTIYLIGGCNGAGKTTFAKTFLPEINTLRFLNADEIARGLSPLQPEAVALNAGRLLLQEFASLLQRRESFAFESTLSGKTYVQWLRRAREAGYRVVLHYVWIPDVQASIRRVRQRVRHGGHHVPRADIERRFLRSQQHLVDDYIPLADEWRLWNNSQPPAKLLAASGTHAPEAVRLFFSHHAKVD